MANPDYPNPHRVARLLRAFETALLGRANAYLEWAHLRKVNAQEEIEALKQIGIDDEPTITYVQRLKEPQRKLGLLSRLRYNRDTARLRKYNDQWIKNNIK